LNFTHNVLHMSLEAARRLRLISHNPTEDVTPPRRPDGNAGERALSADQLQVLDTAMAGREHEPIWRFLLYTGVRWGEAASLRRADVDLTPGREQVTIARAATRVHGSMLVRGPKAQGRKGHRTIPLAPDTVAALAMQRTRVLWLRKRAEEFGSWSDVDGDPVFPNQHGRLLRSNNPLVAFKKVLAEPGLPPKRLHDCGTPTLRCYSPATYTRGSPRTCSGTRAST
jgi:integrase